MKRIIIIILSLLMLSLSGIKSPESAVFAEEGSTSDDTYIDVDLKYPDGISQFGTSNNDIFFNSEYFFEDNTVFHRDIAKCSMALSAAAYNYSNLSTALTDLGFNFDGYTNTEDGLGNWKKTGSAEDNDFVRYIIADKVVTHENQEYIIYCVPVQGTNGGYDWISNFNLGEEENHEGFYTAREEILYYLYSRMQNDEFDKAHTILWTTGHSRGAAIANIVAGEVTIGNTHNGIADFSDMISGTNVFGYTFATPNVSRNQNVLNIKNVFNVINKEDFVTKIPFTDWGYRRYGVNIELESYYKEVVDVRYNKQFEHDFKGNPDFADILAEEIVPMIIENQIRANDIAAKSIMMGFAYLMNGGHDFGTFLEYVGFTIEDNFWELCKTIVGRGFPDIAEMWSYQQRYQALIPVIKTFAVDTAGMSQTEFDLWKNEHQDTIDEIEDVFNRNIKTRQDLVDIVLILPMDVVFTFVDADLSANDVENLLIIFGDIYGYFHDMGGEYYGFDTVVDCHRSTTYLLWTNAQYLGYWGFYKYDGSPKTIAFEDEMIRTIGNECFENATGVTNLIMNDNIEYLGYYTCKDAVNLKKITLSNNLRNIPQNAFYNCYSWEHENLTIPDTVKCFGEYAFFNCNKLTGTLTLPDADIGFRAFNNCTGITELVMPVNHINDGWKRIQEPAGDYYHPFTGCSALTSFILTGQGEMPEVGGISEVNDYQFIMKGSTTPWGAAGYKNNNEITVVLSEGITSVGQNAFYRCDNLVSVVIPETVTSIGTDAFADCTNLVNASIPKNLTYLGVRAFKNCYSMEINDLTIPETLSKLNECVFMNCQNLTGTLTITENTTIDKYAFVGCSGLTGLVIPLSKLAEGYGAIGINYESLSPFGYCSSLSNFEVTGSGEMATMRVANEEKSMTPWCAANERGATNIIVTLDEGIRTIGYYAFHECTHLKELHLPKTLSKAFYKGTYKCNDATVYYPGCEFEWYNVVLEAGNMTLQTELHSKFVFGYTSEMECEFDDENYVEYSSLIICRNNGVVDHVHTEQNKDYIPVVDETVSEEQDCVNEGVRTVEVRIWRNQDDHDYVMTHDYAIAANGHTHGQEFRYNTVDPKCEEEGGYDIYFRCTVCGTDVYYEHVIIPALGHDWDEGVWDWSKDGVVTVTWFCNRLGCGKTHSETVNTSVVTVEATTENDGYRLITGTVTDPNGNIITDSYKVVIPRIGSDYEFVEIYLDETDKEFYARFIDNSTGEYKDTLIEKVSYLESQQATCAEGGYDLYYVQLPKNLSLDGLPHNLEYYYYTSPRLEHTLGETVEKNYTELSCETDEGYDLVKYCSVCGERVLIEHVIITPTTGHNWSDWKVKQEASCETDGYSERTCSNCQKTERLETPATGHNWSEVQYKWSDDHREVTATRVCQNDSSHIETETTGTSMYIHSDADCTTDGWVTYTAYFDNEAFGTQVYDEITPAYGHKWSEPDYEWTYDYNIRAFRVCENDHDHQETEWGKVTASTVEPTCTADGKTVYTATFENPAFTTQILEEVIPASDHSWGGWEVIQQSTCSEPGILQRECSVCHATEQMEQEMIEHQLLEPVKENEKQATCTEEGGYDMVAYCAVCGQGIVVDHQVSPALGHRWSNWKQISSSTCTEQGYEERECSVCHEKEKHYFDALGHNWGNWVYNGSDQKTHTHTCQRDPSHSVTENCSFDEGKVNGNSTVYTCKICGGTYTVQNGSSVTPSIEGEIRVAGSNRFGTSKAIASTIRNNMGVEKLDTVILASGSNFADALAGSYLAAVKNAPILITRQDKVSEINAYIKENVTKGGTIYVLGGTAAVPDSCLSGLSGYTIKRLAGNNRYLTNLEILKAAGMNSDSILVATGTNFADSLSASASGLPMLLVRDDGLTNEQREFLNQNSGKQIYILGGTGAVKPVIESQLKSYGKVSRIAGSTRFETSAFIAEKFYPDAKYAVIAYSNDYPDGLCGGPLAYQMQAPLILTRSGNEDLAARYVQSRGIEDGYILGGVNALPDSVAVKVFGHKIKTVIDQ